MGAFLRGLIASSVLAIVLVVCNRGGAFLFFTRLVGRLPEFSRQHVRREEPNSLTNTVFLGRGAGLTGIGLDIGSSVGQSSSVQSACPCLSSGC